MNDIAGLSNKSVANAPSEATRPLALADLAAERQQHLPRDYPRLPGDAVGLSPQARDIESRGGPVAEPMSFWDHATRSAPIEARQLAVDASGSYKLE